MTNEIFRQFSKCAKAGFLTSNKLEVMNPNYLLKKELDIEFTNIAYEIFSRYENSSSTEIKKNYEFKTARNETAVADIIVEAEKDITLIGLICSTDEPNWWDIQNLAYTYYIANQTGIRFDKVCIANIRKEYVLNNQLTHELIKIKDYTKKIIRLQPRIESTLKRLKEKLRNNAMPANRIDYYCIKPNICPFKNYCLAKEIQSGYNIFELNDLSFYRKLQLYRSGFTDYTKLPEETILSLKSQNQIDSAKLNKEVIAKSKLKEWLKVASTQKFVWFLELETYSPIIPIGFGSKPLTVLPFLYSLYYWDLIKDTQGSFQKIISPSITIETEKDLVHSLIQQLNLNKNAPIVVGNFTTAKNCLANLAILFPELKTEVNKISNRLIDIQKIFVDHIYYSPLFKGSSYLKDIIPVICPDFSYKDIKIQSGIQAQIEFSHLKAESIFAQSQIKQSLIEYARKDVYGLFKIFELLGLKAI